MGCQVQASPLYFNALSGHAQADSRAFDGAGALGGTLKKWFKHALFILLGDGLAGIGHINH